MRGEWLPVGADLRRLCWSLWCLRGGTLALNIASGWDKHSCKNSYAANAFGWFAGTRAELGWQISPVATLADLLSFARLFSRCHYGDSPSLQERP